MTETDNIKVHPSFSGWPLSHFEKFQDLAIEETGEPGIYWLTVKILMERTQRLTDYITQLEKQLVFYEESLYAQAEQEPSEKEEETKTPITLGGHE